MKYKVLFLTVLVGIVYSCATKSNVPTAEVKKTEPIVAESIATVMTAELAEGKSLYENNCAKCHSLYSPKDYTATQWKPIVDRMKKQAELDDVQGQKIYNYLTMK